MPQIDIKNAELRIKDGSSPTANELTVKIGEGNFTYSEKRNMEYLKDRGKLDNVREGDEEPVEVSFDFQWEWLRYASGDIGSDTCTIEEALKKIGAAADWESSGDDPCEPYCVDLILDHSVECGSVLGERITFHNYRWESLDHDLRAGTVSSQGKCNEVSPTVIRTAL